MATLIRFLAIVFSVLLFFPTGSSSVEIGKEDEQNCLLSATVLADLHMESNSRERHQRIGSILQTASQADTDVLLLLGDNTMNSQLIESLPFYGLVGRLFEKDEVIIAAGNHDLDGNEYNNSDYAALSSRFVFLRNSIFADDGDKVWFSREVNGYRFLVLGGDAQSDEDGRQVLSDGQLDWLEAELALAAEEEKPCFVLNHYLVEGRNGMRSYSAFNLSDNNDRLTAILENSGVRTFYLSGHSHFGVDSTSVDTVGNVTYINLPSAGNEGNYTFLPDAVDDAGVGLQIEVYADHVRLGFYNYLTQQWLEDYDHFVF